MRGGIILRMLLVGVLLAAVWLLPGCGSEPTMCSGYPDLGPFREMARNAECADLRNQLFLVDGRLVFWCTASDCSDASHLCVLFACTVDQVLCESHDSVGGSETHYYDTRYRDMFDIMMYNLDRPDFGLGPRHEVIGVPF